MTIRNFLPGFGMRTVARWVAAAVVVAALLAVGSPASAQTPPSDEIWSATMTVAIQNHPTRVLGNQCRQHRVDHRPQILHRTKYSTGTHTDAELKCGSRKRLFLRTAFTSVLVLKAGDDPEFDDNELESMTLHIGGSHSFAFDDATKYSTFDATATPTHGRVPAACPHGLPGRPSPSRSPRCRSSPSRRSRPRWNTAETTMPPSRPRSSSSPATGSTDNALSFDVNNAGMGDSEKPLTRTFKAGQSSFSNFHWAIDVDNSNNPICLILWQIVLGTALRPGHPI